ncbi:MAG TPA: type II secretion system protein GspL [Gammaproteobacteria bacterium]
MAERLLIHFKPCAAKPASWALVNERGELTTAVSEGQLSDITTTIRHATLLLDTSCISLDSVQIPSTNKQRQLKAVPFALEDKLADDIEQLHFALGARQDEQGLPVATIEKSLLDNILQQCQQANLKIQNIFCDVLALPFTDKRWTILLDHDRALIKSSHAAGLYCDRDNLSVVLASLQTSAETPAEAILLLHHDDDTEAAQLLNKINTQLSIETWAGHSLSVFAKHLGDARQLNLLQGAYTPRREGSKLWQYWKVAATITGIWLALQFVYAAVEIKLLHTQNQQLTASIEKEFKAIIPDARKFNNMQKRAERRLQELRGGGTSVDDDLFLQMLADAATALSANSNISIHGMVYRNKHIDFELQADSLQSLETMNSQLSSIAGIKSVLSTSVEKDKVKGRLRLEKQG